MERLPIPYPRQALNEITDILVPTEATHDSALELILIIEDENVNVREFGAFFSFIDRVYGRLSPEGIYSYSHNEQRQIIINTIERGSVEVSITKLLSQISESQNLIILWLALKYLPSLIKSGSEVIRNFAQSYKEYEVGRLSREQRKRLRSQMQDGEITNKLNEQRISQLVDLLDTIYSHDGKQINAPIRFSRKFLRQVKIQIKRKKKN